MRRRTFLGVSGLAGLALTTPIGGLSSALAAEWPPLGHRGDEEAALEPGLPIVDPHHHLWDVRGAAPRFMLPDLLAEIRNGGHNIVQTVFIECGSMYRAEGPPDMRYVGEVEFVNGVAAQSASGQYGPTRVASGIVGHADFTVGDRIQPLLDAELAAGDGRLRGIRMLFFWTDIPVMGEDHPALIAPKGITADPKVRQGMAQLASRNLSLDLGCFHPQLPEVADLASALPNVTMILNHMATPLTIGRYAAKPDETFAEWKRGMTEVAKRPNVMMKLGGMGQDWNYGIGHIDPTTTSAALAQQWKPWIETSIELFGPQRCMFESNFPVDQTTCSYGALWNAFKRITASYSAAEKATLYSGTARRVYRLPPPPPVAA